MGGEILFAFSQSQIFDKQLNMLRVHESRGQAEEMEITNTN